MLEFNVYSKQREKFSLQKFEDYCRSLNLDITLDSDFELETWEGGFLPVRFSDARFADQDGNCEFSTGFEVYYEHFEPKASGAVGFFKKLFRKKAQHDDPFSEAAEKGYTCMISLVCGAMDSFEVLMALVFSGYFVKMYGGAFEDPQSEWQCQSFSELEAEIDVIIGELLSQKESGELLTHTLQDDEQ